MKAIIIAISLVSMPAMSWVGPDYNSGDYVSINGGYPIEEGQNVDYLDYNTGELRQATVESIDYSGSGAEIRIFDMNSGTYRTFDMD